jgi:2,5-dihydroxypyridine 5,6-dioxygenase
VENLPSLHSLITAELKLCKVKPGEKVAVLSTGDNWDRQYVDTLLDCASDLGADAAHVNLGPKASGPELVLPLTRWSLDMMKSADIVLVPRQVHPHFGYPQPVPSPMPEYSEEISELMMSGARYLDITLPVILQRRMFPTEERAKRVRAAASLLDKAKTVRVTSDSGTDLTIDKSGRPGEPCVGYAASSGDWDTMGWGCTYTSPIEDSANGTVIIEPADILQTFATFVRDPIKLTFKDGYIVDIQGGADAVRIKRHYEHQPDKEAYGTSHIGFGLHEKAGGASPAVYNHRDVAAYCHNYAGSILLATGLSYLLGSHWNKKEGAMGLRKSADHFHYTLFNQNIYLDDELMVKNGKIVHPDCAYKGDASGFNPFKAF